MNIIEKVKCLFKRVKKLEQEVNGGGSDVTWTTIEGKPAFVAEGANAAAARTALGLGSAATTSSTAYATSAQGTLADTAIQPDDLGELGIKDTIEVPVDITATGTASATTYLRGDGSWATPTNTTYSVISDTEFDTGTLTTARVISAVSLNRDIQAKIISYLLSLPGATAGNILTVNATGDGFEWVAP